MSVSALLLLATAAVAGAELTFVLATRPRIAMAIAVVTAVANAQTWDTSIQFGSLTLTPLDFVCVAFAAATGLRVALGRGRRPNPLVVSVFAIYLFALARGANQFGFQTAANEGRELFYFLAAAAYFSTVRVDFGFILSFRRMLTAGSVFLVGAAAVFWLQRGFGTYSATGDRALNGNAALLLLETTIFLLVLPIGRGSMRRIVPIAFLGVLLLSEQRTVWVAALAAIAALYFCSVRVGAHRTRRALSVIVTAGVCVVLLALASGAGGVNKSLDTAYGSSFSGDSTFSWRTAGWEQLVRRQIGEPVASVALGNPAGTGFARVLDGQTVDVAPHSEYIELFITVGLLALVLVVYLYGSQLRKLFRLARRADTDLAGAGLAMFAILVTELVFFTTYSIGMSGGVLLGVAIGLTRSASRSTQHTQPVTPAARPEPGTAAVAHRRRFVGVNDL